MKTSTALTAAAPPHRQAPRRPPAGAPNSLGFQRAHLKLNASAGGAMAAAGPLALVSQSGALTSSILDWAARNGVGFSAVISLGPNTNTAVKLPQALDFLANDGSTQSIPVYMEGIRNARRFTSKCCLATLLDPRRGRAASAGPGGAS